MSIHIIDQGLFDQLLQGVSGERFEKLAQKIFAAELGDEFVSLGGMHDGGADGFLESIVFAGKKPNTFYQFCKSEESRTPQKIKDTIKALKKAGREPKQIVYATYQLLPKQDVLRQSIFEEYEILLTVNDGIRLKGKIDNDSSANKAFLEFFTSDIERLKSSLGKLSGSVNEYVSDPTVFAFLDYELKDQATKSLLQDRILDSLIYWALRNTDPDKNQLALSHVPVELTMQRV